MWGIEFRLEQDRLARLAEDERTSAQPRPAGGHRHLMGIGSLRLQLIVLPSFEEPRAWEVRQRQQEWGLFRSQVVEPDSVPWLVGYEPVRFESEQLRGFFRRATALTLPLGPNLDGFGGADGSLYQFAAFSDDLAEFRFQWWSVPPPPWQPLVSVANDMIQSFLMAEGWSAEDSADWLE